MQSNLAVRARAQPMSARFKFALDRLILIELAVRNDMGAIILARNRLVARGEIDNAQPRMAKSDAIDPG